MQFENQTPFPGLVFEGIDQLDQSFHVALVRITYDLAPGPGRVPLHPEATHHLRISEEPTPLADSDEFVDKPNLSSVKWESDFVPYKPMCDLIVLADAHAPGGKAVKAFHAAVTLRRPDSPRPLPLKPQGLNPYMDPSESAIFRYEELVARAQSEPLPGEELIHKELRITGDRKLRRKRWPVRAFQILIRFLTLGIAKPNPWTLTRPKPVTSLPLQYEHAFGGLLAVPLADDKAARLVPKNFRLPEDRREELGLDGPLAAYSRSEANPLGKGYAEPWVLKALGLRELPAPQIEAPDHPFAAKPFWMALRGKKAWLNHPSLQPAGLGPIGRSWSPRRQLAGTYDQEWLKKRHPLLPKDFDFAYWNCAHPTMQCPHLEGNELLTLTNLVPYQTPGAAKDGQGNTVLRLALPGHAPFVLARFEDGTVGTLPMKTDTLIVDLKENQVIQVARVTLMKTHSLRALELRMKLNRDAMPESPLIYTKEHDRG